MRKVQLSALQRMEIRSINFLVFTATLLFLLYSSTPVWSQELYKPEIKERILQEHIIKGPKGRVKVMVENVDGALVLGGDIVLQPKGGANIAGISRLRLWKDGIIPYKIDPNHPFRGDIIRAIETLNSNTVLWYREAVSDLEPHVSIVHGSDCHSGLGTPWGAYYEISLGPGCERQGTIMHELLHAAGVIHEHQRHDRDQRVFIVWENIENGKKIEFYKTPWWIAGIKGPYDFASVMHYPCDAFNKSGNDKTILAPVKIGQRVGLSHGDVEGVNELYRRISPKRNKPAFPVQPLPVLTYDLLCTPDPVDCDALLRTLENLLLRLEEERDPLEKKDLRMQIGAVKRQIRSNNCK